MGGIVGAIGGLAGAATGSSWLPMAASVAGGLLGGSGGGDAPQQTQTTNSAPWSAQAPHLSYIMDRASAAYRYRQTAGPQYYPGQTYADFSPQTQNALNLTEQQALGGHQIDPLAQQQMDSTLSGNYLYGNPGFNAALDAASNRIIPQVESRYAQGGRYGSGLARQAETSALADSFANQYSQERANQQKSMAFAPQLAQQQAALNYQDLAALAGVGTQRDTMAQAKINDAMARYNYNQNFDWINLQNFKDLVNGNYGGTTSSTTTGFPGNTGAGILGGALAGLRFGSGLQQAMA